MNLYSPENENVVTDSMAAQIDEPTAAAQQTEPAQETPNEAAVEGSPAPAQETPADSEQTANDTRPAVNTEDAQSPAKGGPDAGFAARRQQMEQAQAQARQQLFAQMTAGMLNPQTQQPFKDVAEWNVWQEEMRLQRLARETGQELEAVRRMEADADARAKARYEASDEYLQLKAQAEAAHQQMQEMQFAQDLAEIKAAYPAEQARSVKDLGQRYMQLRAAGVDNITAYKVLQAEAVQTAAATPPSTGDVKNTPDTRKSEFYTREELERMSDADLDANFDKVMESLKRLGR